MDMALPHTISLSWANVGLGLSFIFVDVLVSNILHLGVGSSHLVAAFRCIIQLAIMGLVLQKVFETNNPWVAGGVAFVLNLLGTFEVVVIKSKKRYDYMFLSVLISMLGSTMPISIAGARYAMAVTPFWTPEQYIPVVGMLCGGTISSVVITVAHVLKEIHDSRDKLETYLSFGASRFEACWPIACEGLRLALTPIICQMSVIGLIAIPGTMTGALLGGSSVEQAARLQMVIIFMLSASTTLASILTTITALFVVVDGEHRIRPDRIHAHEHPLWRVQSWVLAHVAWGVQRLVAWRRREKERTEWEMMPTLPRRTATHHTLLPTRTSRRSGDRAT